MDAFVRQEDYEEFLGLLKEASLLFNIRVVAYCLMPNHYHLLVCTPDANLSRFMRHVNGVYTQRYNVAHSCDGSLFKGRYKSILVDADSYLLQLVRYIHRNPLRAGLSKTLDDYPWSSHGGYVSRSKKWGWLSKDKVLAMLNPGVKNPVDRYKRFMGMDDSEELTAFFSKKKMPPILGLDDFIQRIKDGYFEEKAHSEIPESKGLAPSVEEIIRMVANEYGVDESELFKTRRGMENEPRNMAVYLVRELRADALSDIAPEFDLTRYSSVSSILERVRKKMNKNKAFFDKYKLIKKGIYTRKSQK